MLAAMSVTTLSSRCWAPIGSAMTSRSFRKSTRGPASAPRLGAKLTS